MCKKLMCALFAVLSIDALCGQAHPEIGDRRELFVDHYLVDRLDNVRLVLHAPVDEGPAIIFDNPWESSFSGYVTVMKDGDVYRAYYRGTPVASDGQNTEFTCYAESKDGVTWTKPDLGIHKVDGTLKNNVIIANDAPIMHNFSPFIDTNPDADPQQRYKAIGGIDKSGLMAYASPDGIHWKKVRDEPISRKGQFDSQNVAFWSESEKKYICYFRIWSDGNYTQYKGIRTVARMTSDDFLNWTAPEPMSFGDTPMEHLYINQTSPYFRAPHIYTALAARFMPNRQVVTAEQAGELGVDHRYFKDCSDVVLMTSRGGNLYDRTFMEALIRPGIGMSNWVSRSNYPALNVIQTGPAEMSVYVNQNYAQPTAYLNRYSFRLDGFSSLQAPYGGGEVLTKVFTFTGKELEINYSTSAPGELKFEIQDENGVPVPGFTMDDSDTIIGNEIARIVSWKGNKNLQSLSSKNIRLRIRMKDADLYSIKFNN